MNGENLCKICKKTYEKLEEWEIKWKKTIIGDCPKDIHWNESDRISDGGNEVRTYYRIKSTNKFCFNCGQSEIMNGLDDIKPCCNSKKLVEITSQNMIKFYFISNKVNNIELKLDELTISYLDGNRKQISSNSEDEAYEGIKLFMQNKNLTTLTRKDLNISKDNNRERERERANSTRYWQFRK